MDESTKTTRLEMILRVRCPGGTFRRAGILFGPAWTIVDHTQLSDEQITRIEDEPLLAHEWLEPADKGKVKKAP